MGERVLELAAPKDHKALKEKQIQRELEKCTFVPKINRFKKEKPIILSPEEEEMDKFKSMENPDDDLNRDVDNDLREDSRHWVERLA